MTHALAEKSWTVALRAPTAEKLEISVYDFIGEGFFGEGVSAKDVLAKLGAAPKATEITLRVNSSGGVVDDAKAMINLLADRKAQGAKVNAFVDGMAASSASYLLTVADHVTVASNAFVMFHQARTGRMGNAKDMAEAAEMLNRVNDQLAEGYASASERRGKGKSKDDFLRAMANGDTYLDADQAIEWGLADAKSEPLKAVAVLADPGNIDSGAPNALRAAAYVARPAPVVAASKITTPAPDGPAVQQPTLIGQEPKTMTASQNSFPTTVALALGLPSGSSESDIISACTALRERDTQGVAIAGVTTGAELVGALRGLKAKADLFDAQATELKTVKAERDKQNFETLIAKGKEAGQLVPATAKMYEDRFAAAVEKGTGADVVADLTGFIAVAPRIAPKIAIQNRVESAAAPLVWNGKAYADLKPMEKDRLSREDPELFAHMRRDHQQSVA